MGTNLNVGDAERGEAGDARTRDAGRLEVEHGLEASLQICYGRGHCDVMGCSGNLEVKGEERVHAYAAEAEAEAESRATKYGTKNNLRRPSRQETSREAARETTVKVLQGGAKRDWYGKARSVRLQVRY